MIFPFSSRANTRNLSGQFLQERKIMISAIVPSTSMPSRIWPAENGDRRPMSRFTRLGFLPAPARLPPCSFLIGVESPAMAISGVPGAGIGCGICASVCVRHPDTSQTVVPQLSHLQLLAGAHRVDRQMHARLRSRENQRDSFGQNQGRLP